VTPSDTSAFIRVRGTQPLTPDQVARAVAAVESQTSPYAFQAVAEFYALSAWQTRFGLVLVGAFAGLAVTLCLTGVYAVLAFAVAGRTSEFGVRLALGAARADIARMVLRDGLRMTLPGLAAGLLLAAAASRGLTHLLFGVGAVDPGSYALTLLARPPEVSSNR
jgi:ABC-type antimicrobial peptide transport system permease subunit